MHATGCKLMQSLHATGGQSHINLPEWPPVACNINKIGGNLHATGGHLVTRQETSRQEVCKRPSLHHYYIFFILFIYITAIQCSWVKRTTQHWGDNWRYDLKVKCFGNPLIADKGTFTFRENPILSNISTSFGKFKLDFTSKENNYKKALILNNPFFRRGRNDNGILCERFFGNNYEELRKISKLKFEDFFVRRDVPKSLDELNREFSTTFALVTYMRLHEALEFAANKKANED